MVIWGFSQYTHLTTKATGAVYSNISIIDSIIRPEIDTRGEINIINELGTYSWIYHNYANKTQDPI